MVQGPPSALRSAWAARGRATRRFSMRTPQHEVAITVGSGILQDSREIVPEDWRQAFVVTQAAIPLPASWPWPVIEVPNGERAKRLAVVERVAEELASAGATRGDGLIAIGGGVVTDLAGFVAATYHRGIDFVAVPTSLLGMVDAAIGGKTAVNLRAGKNLVGAFWQPRRVVADLDVLATLPRRQWRSGLGELAKYAFLGLDRLVELPLDEAVAEAAQAKARVVERDEREHGERALLNYGHTVGHAIEAAALARRRPLSHGEAVAIGLVVEAIVAERLGRITRDRVIQHVEVVARLGLAHRVPPWIGAAEVMVFLAADKKHRGSLAMVLDGPSGLELVHGVPEAVIVAAIDEARA
ncbi:3-dehydroquinate synthase [Acidimicrobium ferrooxidans DSM 10331]|uniref:3-dehydroquinate synthase n=2 Tax=Acidimicrobium ferrooxidans TaxID=53635 RepID=C7M0X5_ACIFD|nr:3-dehydroquinate synthase [Acidimicrobium ferrooxidans DSM 10331]